LRGKCTEHNLLHVTNKITEALNNGKYCVGLFLDLKKAFDVCSHEILLKKLEKGFGINGSALLWFQNYLSNRMQIVDINGTLSQTCNINISVLQGSILGPILFLCYINDLPNVTNLDMFLFADDASGLKAS
jgi:Reverse transcriptase (RNA-dependent DNA polymerase)